MAASNGHTYASIATVGVTYSSAGEATVGADVNAAEPIHDWHPDSGRVAQAFMTADPGMSDVDDILLGHSALQKAFEKAEVVGLGSFDLAPRQGGPGDDGVGLTAEFEFDVIHYPIGRKMIVGFLNPEVPNGEDLIALHLRARDGNDTLFDQGFSDPEEAILFFDGLVLDADTVLDLKLTCTAYVDADHGGFGMDLIVGLVPIPEPGTGLLLGVGLLVLALRPRSARF